MNIKATALIMLAVFGCASINCSPFTIRKIQNETLKTISLVINEVEVCSTGANTTMELNTQVPLINDSKADQFNFKETSGSANRLSNTSFIVGPKESRQLFNLLVSRTINTVSPNKQFPGTTHSSEVAILLFENTLNKVHHDTAWERTKRFTNTNQSYDITVRFTKSSIDDSVVPHLLVTEHAH